MQRRDNGVRCPLAGAAHLPLVRAGVVDLGIRLGFQEVCPLCQTIVTPSQEPLLGPPNFPTMLFLMEHTCTRMSLQKELLIV